MKTLADFAAMVEESNPYWPPSAIAHAAKVRFASYQARMGAPAVARNTRSESLSREMDREDSHL